jgi:simple sugar transport system ATP-binding protein
MTLDGTRPKGAQPPIIEGEQLTKRFGGREVLSDVDLAIDQGEIHCLLGDNGAGKSTLIRILSGRYQPDAGRIFVDGEEAAFGGPRDAIRRGIATVHQGAQGVPLMSVGRNFFLGAEPTKGRGPFRRLDTRRANEIAVAEVQKMGIRRVTDGDQAVGTLSGGERQALFISRAIYFGARAVILDEPTAALGVKEAETVLRLVSRAQARGIGIIYITHNATHAMLVGDRFTVLIHGRVATTFRRGERTPAEVLSLMAGGEVFESLADELERERGSRGGEMATKFGSDLGQSDSPQQLSGVQPWA